MRFLLLLILIFISINNAMAQFAQKRQVLIFGPLQSQQVTRQLTLLEQDAAGVRERDMHITLAAKEPQLYKKHNVEPSDTFTLILLGKDRGEKYRSTKLTAAQELFDLIDAMPMRQSEMRRKKRQ